MAVNQIKPLQNVVITVRWSDHSSSAAVSKQFLDRSSLSAARNHLNIHESVPTA